MDHPSQRSYGFDLAYFTPGALLYPISNPLWDLCLLEGSLLCWVTVLPTTPEPLALKKQHGGSQTANDVQQVLGAVRLHASAFWCIFHDSI